MIELIMRIAATVGLSGVIGYTSVCIASQMAWIGACSLLIPVYYKMMKTSKMSGASANVTVGKILKNRSYCTVQNCT